MRFMILVKASKESEAGMMPSQQLLIEMGKFNEELDQDLLVAPFRHALRPLRRRLDGERRRSIASELLTPVQAVEW